MIEPKFGGELIRFLMDEDGYTHKQANIFLAAKCFTEIRKPSAIQNIASELFQHLSQLFSFELHYYYDWGDQGS